MRVAYYISWSSLSARGARVSDLGFRNRVEARDNRDATMTRQMRVNEESYFIDYRMVGERNKSRDVNCTKVLSKFNVHKKRLDSI